MRAIPDSMDAAIVDSIDARLETLERDERVAIPWAIESGSRAWGFPSPDSDYDSRFFYLRTSASYLSPWQPRDVIETPLDKIFDVNGWDLVKAVRLLAKGNGTVTEWLRSPIVYRGDPAFRASFLELAESVLSRDMLGRHYLHLGTRQWADAENASLKKVFYALRPAAILRWLDENPDRVVPPMDLASLLAECDPPADVLEQTTELVALKSVTREVGRGEIPPAIARFITEEYERGTLVYEDAAGKSGHPGPEAIERCESFFRSAVERFAPVD